MSFIKKILKGRLIMHALLVSYNVVSETKTANSQEQD